MPVKLPSGGPFGVRYDSGAERAWWPDGGSSVGIRSVGRSFIHQLILIGCCLPLPPVSASLTNRQVRLLRRLGSRKLASRLSRGDASHHSSVQVRPRNGPVAFAIASIFPSVCLPRRSIIEFKPARPLFST